MQLLYLFYFYIIQVLLYCTVELLVWEGAYKNGIIIVIIIITYGIDLDCYSDYKTT